MKRTITIILVLVFSASFCMAQGGGQDINKVKQEIELKFNNAIGSAKENIKQGRYDAAIDKYQEAIKLKPEETDSINAEINNVKRLKKAAADTELEKRFNDAIASAERNFSDGRYDDAIQDYSRAFDLKPERRASFESRIAELNELILIKAREDAEQVLLNEYNNAIANAETSVAQQRYADAKNNYLTALVLKDENADFINSKIAELEKPASLNIYYKNSSVLGLFPINYDVIFDGVVVGRTKNKWKITEAVGDFGEKTLSAAYEERGVEIRIDFEPGKVYYVRASETSKEVKTGEWGTKTNKNGTTERYEKTKIEYTPKLELVSVSLGEREFNAIKSK